jgi:hypothetical protein
MMKTLRFIGIIFLISILQSMAEINRTFYWTDEEIDRFYADAASDRGTASQYASLQRLRETVRNVGQKTPHELIPDLGEALRKLSRENIFQVRERIEVYELVQSTLLSVPGHARFFADEIRREQKEVAQYPANTGPRISYDRNRSKYFITLTHLPSPETIAVLGEFLSDDIDTPRLRISPHSDWGENPRANSFTSTNALSLIGLRDPPASKDSYDADPDAHLAKSRAWWEEVKTGERTFSFKGQAVEYRFRPDGTWETIPIANPPDDGPKPAVAAPASGKRDESPATVDSVKPADRSLLWWITGVLLAVALALFIKFRRTA